MDFSAKGCSPTASRTERSIPAQKASPAPVSTTTRTDGSVRAERSASAHSLIISSVNAFFARGRLSRIVAMPSATEYSRSAMNDLLPRRHAKCAIEANRLAVQVRVLQDVGRQVRVLVRATQPLRIGNAGRQALPDVLA